MSLSSFFGALGNIANSLRNTTRSVPLFTKLNSTNNNTSSWVFLDNYNTNNRYLAYIDTVFGDTGKPTLWHIYDANDGKIRIYRGTQKTTALPMYPAVLNPINNALITRDPVNSTSFIQYSTDYGVNWTTIGSGDVIQGPPNLNTSYFTTGGWWDNTNFAFTTSFDTFSTTNGTSWSTITNFGQPPMPGNNYSFYSGYYFSYPGYGSYRYRTSITGSDTTVSGYQLMAMSLNGRYLIRKNTSTWQAEYSNDGGSSWSAFSNDLFIDSIDPGQMSVYVISNKGDFLMLPPSGAVFNYSFSENRWVSSTALFNRQFARDAFVTNIQGKEVIISMNFINASASSIDRNMIISDFPRISS